MRCLLLEIVTAIWLGLLMAEFAFIGFVMLGG